MFSGVLRSIPQSHSKNDSETEFSFNEKLSSSPFIRFGLIHALQVRFMIFPEEIIDFLAHTAIDCNNLPCYVRSAFAQKEEYGSGDFLWLTHSPHRD